MLKPDERPRPFSLTLNGIRWSGFWCMEEGGKALCVASAYGGSSRPLGRRKPERLAEELLMEILAAKLKECEAKRRRLSPSLDREP